MKKSVKKYQPGGLVDSEGNPVRDGSGNPIMTGSFPDEDEITARGRAKNAEMFKSLVNRVTGRGKEAATPKAAPAATPKAAPAATPKAAPKASDGDVSAYDLRTEAAASAPKRVPTRPGQSSSGPKPAVVTKKQLTPRDDKTSERKGDMDIKSPAERRSATRMADVAAKKPRAERRSDTRLRAGRASATLSDEANMMFKKGGSVSSASKRADGIAQRGKTRGRMH